MSHEWVVTELQHPREQDVTELAELLCVVVEEGASVGFLPPLRAAEALAYWKGVWAPHVKVWTVSRNERIVGTVQLDLCQKPNGSHRAEIAKLMVHPASRGQGIARALMKVAEACAVADGRTLLVLDTRAGDPSNLLYQSLNYIEAGRIPEYARSADGELHATVFYYKRLS
ncbi:GNAT family N-acetyltransferase [Tumebacillus permanentifrigoris]|uniref:Acetyltransferase (GNAT) family protein n=1 Tax=Tumebacillus permanentifrigoris TaxID=378543 RepID=A0A316DDL5_9BACL|nr:GNAT family N-acetyltransferase [Tumebacillus permanentifrigoris]PWK15622.1 acetyltransferase (GNAT) family protein [Tumebacillus permanentifrigoris]